MKETMNDLLKSIVISIGMAMALFCLVGIIFYMVPVYETLPGRSKEDE